MWRGGDGLRDTLEGCVRDEGTAGQVNVLQLPHALSLTQHPEETNKSKLLLSTGVSLDYCLLGVPTQYMLGYYKHRNIKNDLCTTNHNINSADTGGIICLLLLQVKVKCSNSTRCNLKSKTDRVKLHPYSRLSLNNDVMRGKCTIRGSVPVLCLWQPQYGHRLVLPV